MITINLAQTIMDSIFNSSTSAFREYATYDGAYQKENEETCTKCAKESIGFFCG